jgi:hypothetical protein
MKAFKFDLKVPLYEFFIIYVIYLMISFSFFGEILPFIIASIINGLLLFFVIVPYRRFSCLIIDLQNEKLIIKRERPLLKKIHKEFDLTNLDYRYVDEYTGAPTKNKVFSIWVDKKREVKIMAFVYGLKQINEFVAELDKAIIEVKKEGINKN